MFGRLSQIVNNALELDQDEITVSIYENNGIQSIITHRNTLDQLSKGLNSDGEIIGVYSPMTDIMNDGQTFTFDGQTFEKIAGEAYNFVMSGDFMSSFRVKVYDDGFSIEADTVKEDGDLLRFGNNILGLTNESKNELAKAMYPIFLQETRRALFK